MKTSSAIGHEFIFLNLEKPYDTKKPVKVKPKPPFITSTLQQSASTRLSFNVKRTMRVAQKLYEAGYVQIHGSPVMLNHSQNEITETETETETEPEN